MVSMFDTLLDILKERVPDLVAVYAFGSRSRGDATLTSDYDIAFLASRPLEPRARWQLQGELSVRAGADIDLVDLRRASTVMRTQVLRDGRLLFEQYRFSRQLFEAVTLSDYARLNEERRGILADVRQRGTVYG